MVKQSSMNKVGQTGDFRVESDAATPTCCLLMRGIIVLGIGTASPASVFTVYRNDTATGGQVLITQAGTGDPNIQFATAATSYMVGIDNSDNDDFKIDYGTTGTGAQTGLSLNTSYISRQDCKPP
jgi:hypothetical protein